MVFENYFAALCLCSLEQREVQWGPFEVLKI